jgi:hypothetical protein
MGVQVPGTLGLQFLHSALTWKHVRDELPLLPCREKAACEIAGEYS